MVKEIGNKMWATILVIAMISATFAGFSAVAWGPGATSGKVVDTKQIDFFNADKQPLHENALNRDSLSLRNDDPTPLSSPPGEETQGVWGYNFDADTVDQWPSIPPWQFGDTPPGQASLFALDDFEDDTVGNNPDLPPWRTVDGQSITEYWTEDFEGFTPGQDISTGQISGSAGYFGNFVPPATLTADAPPAGGPPGTIIPGYSTGALCANFTDPTGGSYWGPAGIGDTVTTAYAGGWVYMNSVARFDILLYDLVGGATRIEVALQNDNLLYHWPGGAYTQIVGPTYNVGEWHEVYIQYDETANTYSVWWDGVQYVAGSAFTAGGNIDSMLWFGDVGTDAYVDNFFHFDPPAGLTHAVDVTNAQAHSGAQSVWIDQNAEAAPDLATTTAIFTTPMAGAGVWDYWFRTDAAIADTNGAVAELMDQADGGVVQIRANAGNFEHNDGGVWTNAMAFAADTWYHFTVNFDTIAKTYTLDIDGAPSGAGSFARESGTLVAVRYGGTGGTQSEHYIDDVNVTCNGAGANITVSNLVSHSAPNALRFQEFNAIDYGFIGGNNLGVGLGGVGTYSFWFYSTDNWGGQQMEIGDVNGGSVMNIIGLGVNLASLEGNPGVVQFVNNDGAGMWVVDGPTYNANEWHQITIEYNCNDMGVSGSTGSYYYSWDGGALQGPYGMIDPVTFIDIVTIYGGAPPTYGDFFYDDFSLSVNAVPGAPIDCWAEVPAPTGVEVFDNYTTDQDNPVYGLIAGTEANTHGAGSEDIREVAINDVPNWANYTADQDNPVEGVVVNDYTNVDEIFPSDGFTEEITEVIGNGGSTFIDYYTDLDIPVNGTVTGTEANTHGAGTQDIQEIHNGGNIWDNHSADLDIPVEAAVTGTFALTQVLDGSSQEIMEVSDTKKSVIGPQPFSPGPGPQPNALFYYNDRPTFDIDAPGLPTENFDNCVPAPGTVTADAGPIDEFTNNAMYTPGQLMSGFSFNCDPNTDLCVVLTTGFSGVTSTCIGANTFVDAGDIFFTAPETRAVGFELLDVGAGAVCDIEIYTTGDVLLGTTTHVMGTTTGTFWGVVSDAEPITRIHINEPGGGGELIDNLVFGEVAMGNTLEHQWRIDPVLPNATALQLIVNARTNADALRDDNFTFEYSEDGVAWNPTGIVVNSSVMTEYTGNMITVNTTTSPLYIRVKDTFNDDWVQNDTVFVDEIRVQYYRDRPDWYTLEHRWRTQNILPGADNISLFVTGAVNVGSDDTFTFGYATAPGGPYTPTTLTVNSDVMNTYSAEIPASLSGQIYIRVMDDNTWADPTQADTIIIDDIWVQRQVGMSLQHVWRTESVDANTLILELFVTARTNTGSDDSFTFGYSSSVTGPFAPMPIVVNSDVMTEYRFVLPTLTGVFYINVIDDNTMDTVAQDTIFVDTIRLEAAISSATVTNQVATADNPDHGTVTGTFALTTGAPDGSAQQIDEIALSKKKASTPDPAYVRPETSTLSFSAMSMPTQMESLPPTAFANAVSQALDFMHSKPSLTSIAGGNNPLAPPPEPGTRAIVLQEDFSAPWIPSTDADIYDQPPGGWDVDGVCTSEAAPGLTRYWSNFDDGVTGFPTSNSTPMSAGVWWSSVEPVQDEWLISPSMDLSGFMNTRLSFNSIYTMPSYGAAATAMDWIKVSTDGGFTWTPIADMAHDAQFEIPGATGGAGGAGWCWYEMYLAGGPMSLDISALADFQADVKVAWHYDITDTAAFPFGIFCVDDVHVDADPAGNSLQHNWTMEPQPADSTTRSLYVNARTDVATDEGFTFGWSQNPGGPFTPVLTIDGTADTFATYSAPLPTGFSGPLYINVIDAVGSDFDPVNESSVFVDAIWVHNDNTVQPLWELEHRWRTEPIAVGAQTLDLHVTAATSPGADDTFTFGYATALGGPYTPVITVSSDVMNTYTAMLPYQLSGAIYLNVIDDLADWAQPGYTSAADTIIVDDIVIEYYSPGGTLVEEFATGDRPGHGNVTGTYALTQTLLPDLIEQQIDEINVTIYPPDTPTGTDEPSPFSPGPGPQPQAQVYYNDRAVFDADGGAALPIEDFEESNAGPGSINGMDAPLDEFTNNAYFAPGDILPGIRIQDNPGPDAGGLVALGVGGGGCPTLTVSTNTFVDSCDIWFDDPAYPCFAIGMDVQTYLNPGNVDIEIYGVGGVLMDTVTAPGDNTGIFWGVISDEQIEHINMYENTGAAVECGDNIAFGIAKKKGHSLAHAWEMDLLPDMLTRTLHMNARTNVGSNDEFTIGYASNYTNLLDDDAWVPLFNVSSDTATDYSAPLPVNFNGEAYIIAWDSNEDDKTPGEEDSLFVDNFYVQSFESAGTTSVDIHWDMSADDFSGIWYTNYSADLDVPGGHGQVTGTFNDVGFPPDTITQDIREQGIGLGSFANKTVTTDIDVEGTRVGTYLDVDEISPPDGITEDITEVVGGGGGPTTFYFESFETGLGVWTADNAAELARRQIGVDPLFYQGPGTVTPDGSYFIDFNDQDAANNFIYMSSGVDMSTANANREIEFWYDPQDMDDAAETVDYAVYHDGAWSGLTNIPGPNDGDFVNDAMADWTEFSPIIVDLETYGITDWTDIRLRFRSDADWETTDEVVVDSITFRGDTPGGNSLEHKWKTEGIAGAADALNLYVRGSYNTGSDDTFSVEYSYDDILYTPAGITINSDVLTTYGPAAIPVTAGTLYLRVVDDNAGDAAMDTVSIDLIRVEEFFISGDTFVDYYTDTDIPSHGFVTGTYANTFEAGTEDIQEEFVPGIEVRINEFHTGADWVEFINFGAVPVDLSGWQWYWNDMRGYNGVKDFPIDPALYTLDPGEVVQMVENAGTDTATLWYVGHNMMWTSSSGGIAGELRDAGGNGVDTFLVGTDTTVPTAPSQWIGPTLVLCNPDGATWRLVDDDTDADVDWQVDPGLAGTPGALNVGQTGMSPPAFSLEHQWSTEAIPAGATGQTLYVEAAYNTGSDDTFTFEYSEDGSTWLPTGITVNSDVMTEYSYVLPAPVTGPLYIKVFDDNRVDAALQDTIYVETIRVEWMYDIIPQYSLEHTWRTETVDLWIQTLTLHVTACTSAAPDDSFIFEYATNLAGPYTPIITVNSAVMTTYSEELPPTRTGGIYYLRVTDSNSVDLASQDTLYVDAIQLEYSGYLAGTGEDDLLRYNIYRADEEDGDTIDGPYELIGQTPPYTDIYYDPGEGLDLVNQAWYYVEAEDITGQVNASGFFSKLNYAPVTSNVMADAVSPRLQVGPFTPAIQITADAFDDSSNYEAIPKMFMAEMFVDVDPGEGNGISIPPLDGYWGNLTTEQLSGPIDFSLYDVGVYEVYVRTAENHTLGAMGSVVWGPVSNVTIEVVDGPPLADAGPDQTVPQHTLVTFDGSFSTDDVGITNYWWNFTDGGPQSLTGVGPSYTFDLEGVYNVTLTVMDRMGQTDTDNMTVTVTDGDPPVADAGLDQFDVPAAFITFDGSASYDPGHLGEPIDDGIVNWTWTFNDGAPVTLYDAGPIHQFMNPGVYMVTLTVRDQVGLTDVDYMNVTIEQIFDIDISQAAGSDDWILVSFPTKIEGDPLTIIVDFLGDTTWDIAQWYDPTDPQPWKTTASFKPASLNDFNYVNNTMGFWIHITAYGDNMIRLVGPLASSGEMAVLNLRAGWNLVGYPFPVGQPSMNTFGTSFSINDAMTYDQADPYRLRAYLWYAAENHDPGQGYWIHCLGDEDLFLWAP